MQGEKNFGFQCAMLLDFVILHHRYGLCGYTPWEVGPQPISTVLDDYDLARAVATFPLPVVVGHAMSAPHRSMRLPYTRMKTIYSGGRILSTLEGRL